MLRDPLLADLPLDDIGPRHFARWRDARLRSVSGSTVSREMNILAHACKLATREWQWLDKNPIKGVSRPQENRPLQVGMHIQQIISVNGPLLKAGSGFLALKLSTLFQPQFEEKKVNHSNHIGKPAAGDRYARHSRPLPRA